MNERGREGEYRLAEGKDRRFERDSVGYRYVTTTGGSAVARTEGRGAEALITVFPEGVESGEVALTRTIVHELSHASGLETEDVAYQGTPLFSFLNMFPGSAGAPSPARRNADSYAHAVASLVAREDPAQTTRVDPAKPPIISDPPLPASRVRFVRATIALAKATAAAAERVLTYDILPWLTTVEAQRSWSTPGAPAYYFAHEELADERVPYVRTYAQADLERARDTMKSAEWLAKTVRHVPPVDEPLILGTRGSSSHVSRPRTGGCSARVLLTTAAGRVHAVGGPGAPRIPGSRETVAFLVRLVSFLGRRVACSWRSCRPGSDSCLPP